MAQDNKSSESRKQARTPILEWVLGGIGAVLIFGCLAYLIHEGIREGGEAPGALTATVLEIIPVGSAYLVTFDLQNSGSQTLSNLQVSARLFDATQREVDRATTTLDYLPGRSSQRGGFYFHRDPRQFTLVIRPEGYQIP
jgi:uncharacterized protein (TIGR02588 family)